MARRKLLNALTGAIIGFVIGVLLVFVLRSLQNLPDPTGDLWLPLVVGLVFALGGAVTGSGILSVSGGSAPKPGLSRAIPAAFLGALAGAIIVYLVRGLQNMDPIWDVNVGIVLMPWTMSFAFLWGMGAFDPRMSEHAHGPEAHDDEVHSDIVLVDPTDEQKSIQELKHDEHHHEAEPERPFAVFSSQIWVITTLTIAAVVSLFAFALLPHNLLLKTTADPAGDPAGFATNESWLTPLGVQVAGSNTFQADKLSVFIGFIIFTVISLFVFGGALAYLFYFLNREVTVTRADPTPPPNNNGLAILVPPFIARLSGRLARGLRNGLPVFFGQK